jgi:hypothetical protein
MASSRVLNLLVVVLCLFASLMFVSYALGPFTLFSPLILAAGALVYFFVFHSRASMRDETIPLAVWIVALAMVALVAHALLLIHPFVDASTDSLHTINVRVLQVADRIPATHDPYSPLPFLYVIGFHLLAKLFVDLLPFLNDYFVLWLLGILLVFIQPLLFFVSLRRFGAEEHAAVLATVLLLGTKVVFSNFFTGLYPWILATDLFLLFVIFLLERRALAYVIFPTIFLVHPGIALYALVFTTLYLLWNHFIEKKPAVVNQAKWLGLSLLLAFPALPSYLNLLRNPVGTNVFASPTTIDFISSLIKVVTPVPLWIGLIPVALGVVGLALAKTQKKHIPIRLLFFGLVAVVAFVAYLFFALRQNPLDNKLIELLMLSWLGGIAFLPWREMIPEIRFKPVLILIAVLCVITFFTSSSLNHYRLGSKVNPEAAAFAFDFYGFDPSPQRVFYFSDYGAKISLYANKSPFDITRGQFISALGIFEPADLIDPVLGPIAAQESQWKEILERECFSCAFDLNVSYVVVETDRFSFVSEREPVFSSHGFEVYAVEKK